MDINKFNSIHFIGIGGISMSGLAMLMLTRGKKVSGSDAKKSKTTDHLVESGAHVYYHHTSDNIKEVDLVVYSSAVSPENPEIRYALEHNIPVINRGVFLGLVMKDFESSINISGTHGKTSTTGFISSIFEESSENATIMIGGMLDKIGGNVKIGDEKVFITEACEYKENFLNFFPTHSVILNIEEDHLDYFKDINHIISSFEKFALKTLEVGYVFLNTDDKNIHKMNLPSSDKIITFGLNEDAIYRAENIKFDASSCPSFTVNIHGKDVSFTLSVPGYHNLYNALAAISVAAFFDIPADIITSGINQYAGTHRRFDKKGYYHGALIVDDYAHHPSAIKITLDSVSRMPLKKKIVIFQPHTYSRTHALLDEFAQSFENADLLLITDIYAAREKDTGLVHSKDVLAQIKTFNPKLDARYISNFDEAVHILSEVASEGDLIITLGAGNVNDICERLLLLERQEVGSKSKAL